MEDPKEKAKELVKRFYSLKFTYKNVSKDEAKQCAKICVAEMIKEYNDKIIKYAYCYDVDAWNDNVEFLKEVKNEIENYEN